MKKLLMITALSALTMASFAQGKSNGKGHGKIKHNTEVNTPVPGTIFNGETTTDKVSKNLPAKVRSSFNRDFPNTINVTWTKNKGVWTARYNGGILGSSQLVSYKANGQRI